MAHESSSFKKTYTITCTDPECPFKGVPHGDLCMGDTPLATVFSIASLKAVCKQLVPQEFHADLAQAARELRIPLRDPDKAEVGRLLHRCKSGAPVDSYPAHALAGELYGPPIDFRFDDIGVHASPGMEGQVFADFLRELEVFTRRLQKTGSDEGSEVVIVDLSAGDRMM